MRLMNESSPFRAAVIGGGPAGFYTAESLIKSHSTAEVDIFDRLPTPYGLVRYGVAPDHQQIKSIARMLARIGQHERVRFLGNVRSEEHTSELQSRGHLVCRLLLEKKNNRVE